LLNGRKNNHSIGHFVSDAQKKYKKSVIFMELHQITTNTPEIFSHFGSVVAESIER
jgi:hypothetical protein